MSILRTAADRALSVLGLTRAAASGPAPGTGTSAVAVDSSAMVSATVAEVGAWIDEHDGGRFAQSSRLADLARRDADLHGALTQRVLALGGLPMVFEPADESDQAGTVLETIEPAWSRVMSRPAQSDMVTSAVMLGFAVGQVSWGRAPASGYLEPRVEAWPSQAVEYAQWEQRWYVQTRTGPLAITPGDGQWILYTPRSQVAPWMWGAIRCVAEWYLRSGYAARDASRHAEIHGVPVWGAMLPSGGRETNDGRAFVRSLRGMGRNAVVPLPRGAGPETSYDLKLIEAQTDAYRIFEFLMRGAAGKMRLAVLGQDLTSQNAQVGTNASSGTGRAVTQDVIASDAESLADCLREQLLAPWAKYLAGDAELAPYVYHDARPQADRSKDATAIKTLFDAVKVAGDANIPLDVRALLQAQGVPLLEKDAQAARQLFGYHFEYGIPTRNEAREFIGLAKVPGGDVPALPVAPPTAGTAKAKAYQLASGDEADGFAAGQHYCDDLTTTATAAGTEALAPDLRTVLDVIEAATSYDDLRERLAKALAGMPADRMAEQVERAMILATLAGRHAVLVDL